jgi:hypothetical protein
MEQPVEDRRGEHVIAKDGAPWVTNWFVVMSRLPRSYRRADELEQEMGAPPLEWQVAELIR